MKYKTKMSALATALIAFGSLGGGANAATLLDIDRFDGTVEIGFFNVQAQTFTVTTAGTLNSIELQLSANTAPVDLMFDIRSTLGGVPTSPDIGANILGSVTVQASNIHVGGLGPGVPLTSIDLSGENINVTAGDVLAFAIYDP